MPHLDNVHALQIALAAALRERDATKAALARAVENEKAWCGLAQTRERDRDSARADLAAAESERDALRAEVKRLVDVLSEAREWILGEGSIVPEHLVGRMTAALAGGGDRGT
jgi:hypothetical protein